MKFKDYLKEGALQTGSVNRNTYVFGDGDDKKGLEKLAKKVDKKAKIATGGTASYIWFSVPRKAEEFFNKYKEKFGMKL